MITILFVASRGASSNHSHSRDSNRESPFPGGLFSGAMLVSGRVTVSCREYTGWAPSSYKWSDGLNGFSMVFFTPKRGVIISTTEMTGDFGRTQG